MHVKIGRRRFLQILGATVLGTALGATYSVGVEPRWLRGRPVSVPVPGLPARLDGLRIAHLTDLHRSRYVSAGYLRHGIEQANRLEPDLMVFTGDYLTHGRRTSQRGQLVYGPRDQGEAFTRDVADCLGKARARHGVFASLGNHDHWYDADHITRALQEQGVPVLRNQRQLVKVRDLEIPVVGLGDLWTEGVRLDVARHEPGAPFTLVLMHNPDSFEDWSLPGPHVICAGHTHGGQVNIPFVGPPLVPSKYGARYAHGLFGRGAARMYVSSGVGLIYPAVRFNCPPEIALLRLHRA